jgi:pimeloyl-ACP methyl ester carboxylesterase
VDVPLTRFAWSGETAVGYQVFGEGAVDLLSLQHWPVSRDLAWEHPGHLRYHRLLGSLARVIEFDPPGLGVSDPVPLDQLGDLDRWLEAALTVLDAVGVERVVIVADGFGGHLAVLMASRVPERVLRVVLSNVVRCGHRSAEPPWGPTPEQIEAGVAKIRQDWGTGRVAQSGAPHLAGDITFLARFERAAASPSRAARMARVSSA